MNLARIKERAQQLKLEALALGFAVKHPLTPWYAKLVVAALVVYAVTPVDLVPDFIPILGFIDDLIFVPLALGLAVRMVPAAVITDCRARAADNLAQPGAGRKAWLALAVVWFTLATVSAALLYRP